MSPKTICNVFLFIAVFVVFVVVVFIIIVVVVLAAEKLFTHPQMLCPLKCSACRPEQVAKL